MALNKIINTEMEEDGGEEREEREGRRGQERRTS